MRNLEGVRLIRKPEKHLSLSLEQEYNQTSSIRSIISPESPEAG